MSLHTSSSLVALSRNEFNEKFLRKFLYGLLESRMVFDKLGPIFVKLKALAISVGFAIYLPFTLIMFG